MDEFAYMLLTLRDPSDRSYHTTQIVRTKLSYPELQTAAERATEKVKSEDPDEFLWSDIINELVSNGSILDVLDAFEVEVYA